ncbi:MAG: HEAT repeat domain-containing protein [Planctomycetota bacterium]
MGKRLPRTLLLLAAFTVAAWKSAAWGDVVALSNGARFTGTAPADQARTTLTFQLEGGGRLTLKRNQVAEVARESPAMSEYRRRSPTAPDTVESQWALAMWCQERKLAGEYRKHLERVVQLDPSHNEARERLGYQQQNGKWLTREQVMSSRGMIRYEGQFRTRQEIAILEREKRSKQQNADWKNTLARWRRGLDDRDPRKVAQAEAKYKELTDPAAGPALAAQLLDEETPGVKRMLLDVAARVRHGATVRTLTELTLHAEDEEIRYSSLEYLDKAQTPGLVEPFVRALKSPSNVTVNRAAAALQELGGGNATAPLIEALVTEHKYKVGESTGGGQRFDINGAGGGFSFGGGGVKIVKRELKNPRVLSALVELTGENFGYDQEQWRAWLAEDQGEEQIDLRRDP